MSSQFFINLDKKYLKRMDDLESKIKRTNDKYKKDQLTRLQSSYYHDILQYTEAKDYSISYVSNSIDVQILNLWTQFIASNPIQVHTSLLANPYLSSTDKLVGGTIDTFVGFCLLTFTNLEHLTVNLNLIAVTNKLSIGQVKNSIHKLQKWADYFDSDTHLGH